MGWQCNCSDVPGLLTVGKGKQVRQLAGKGPQFNSCIRLPALMCYSLLLLLISLRDFIFNKGNISCHNVITFLKIRLTKPRENKIIFLAKKG